MSNMEAIWSFKVTKGLYLFNVMPWTGTTLYCAYPFDSHNVLKRTKISTSEKPTILHGGTSDMFKTGTEIRCLNSHSDISVYLGECSHLQPLWSKLFVRFETHWLSNKLKMELISSNGKTRWYTFWLWWYKWCTVREPMRFETVLCVIHYGKYIVLNWGNQ